MTATPRKRFYHFSYLRQPAGAGPRLYDLRDGDAFAELEPVLIDLGYEYGGLLLNYPPDSASDVLPRLAHDDLVVLTTRPPLDDPHSWGERKLIKRSGSVLEKAILQAVSGFFEICKRPIIKLAPDIACGLSPQFADRAEMEFRVYRRGVHQIPYYRRYRNPFAKTRAARCYHSPTDPNSTAAFLMRTTLGPEGPTLLNAFGMDGVTTLIWCHLLRTKLPDLLDTTGFTMAEVVTKGLPMRPPDLSFADSWRVSLLLTPGGASSRSLPRRAV